MITGLLLGLITTLLSWATAARPQWSMTLPDSLRGTFGFLMNYDTILPITEVLYCVAAGATLVGLYSLYKWVIKLIDWVADIIP